MVGVMVGVGHAQSQRGRGSGVCGAAVLRMQPKGRRAGWAAARLLAKGAACVPALRLGARVRDEQPRLLGTSCRPAAPAPPPRCPAAPLVALVRVRVRVTNLNLTLTLTLTPRCPAAPLVAYVRGTRRLRPRPAHSPEPLPAADRAPGRRLPRPASAHQPLAPRRPATPASFSHMAGRLKASEAGSCTCSHRCGRRFCIFLGVSAAIL